MGDPIGGVTPDTSGNLYGTRPKSRAQDDVACLNVVREHTMTEYPYVRL